MGSHAGKGRYRLYVPSPMRFRRRASAANICIGKALKDKSHGSRTAARDAFTAAAKGCKGAK